MQLNGRFELKAMHKSRREADSLQLALQEGQACASKWGCSYDLFPVLSLDAMTCACVNWYINVQSAKTGKRRTRDGGSGQMIRHLTGCLAIAEHPTDTQVSSMHATGHAAHICASKAEAMRAAVTQRQRGSNA